MERFLREQDQTALRQHLSDPVIVVGHGGELYLSREIQSYARSPFWGEQGDRRPESGDPLPFILTLAADLRLRGSDLLVVPIPNRIALWPAPLIGGSATFSRVDAVHREFLDILRQHGIDALDLTPTLSALPASTPAYPRSEVHWSPAAVEAAAGAIAAHLRATAWWPAFLAHQNPPAAPVSFTARTLTLGPVCRRLAREGSPPKQLALLQGLDVDETVVCHVEQRDGEPIARVQESPLLLIGDAWTLIYGSPITEIADISHAGLADHLAAELGVPLAHRGVLGTPIGAAQDRRIGDHPRRCVIWAFSAHYLSERHTPWPTRTVFSPRPTTAAGTATAAPQSPSATTSVP